MILINNSLAITNGEPFQCNHLSGQYADGTVYHLQKLEYGTRLVIETKELIPYNTNDVILQVIDEGKLDIFPLTTYEVQKLDVTKLQVGDEAVIGEESYKVTGFAFGKAMISKDKAKSKKIDSFDNASIIDSVIRADKSIKKESLIKQSKVDIKGYGTTVEEAIKTANIVNKASTVTKVADVEEIAQTIVDKIKEIKVKPMEEVIVPQEKQPQINLVSFETVDFTGTPTTFYRKGNKWGYLNSNGMFDSLIPNAQAQIEQEYQAKKELEKAEKEIKNCK
jgi:hypothetical protein